MIAGFRLVAPGLVGLGAGSAGPADPTILWWKMTNGSGTTITATVGPNGTTDADWTTSTQSGSGFALEFNGSSDDANSTSSVTYSVNTITVSFWVYSATLTSGVGELFFSKDTPAVGSYEAFAVFGDIYCVLYGSGGAKREETFTCPSNSTWHHIAIIFDNSTSAGEITVYVNGASQSTTLATNTKNASGNIAADTFRLGATSVPGTFFTGRLDDVRIYNSALSAGDISAIHAAGSQ